MDNKATLHPQLVFVSGNFNVLHPGHVRLLRFAKECGTRLVVAVESDRMAGNAAHVPEQLRLEGIQSNIWVDEAFLLDGPVAEALARLKPDVVVKGKEHESLFNPELAAVEQYGGKLLFSSGETLFSSLDLIRKAFYESDPRSISAPKDYLGRHAINSAKAADILRQFTRLRVCIVGDLIIDEYITCQPLGMSQEDPTIVVTPIDTTQFIGGAGIVAAHAAGLGASVRFLSVTGADAAREFALERLAAEGIEADLLVDESRPTTRKQRFRSKGKTLLRVSYLHQAAIPIDLQNQILERLEQFMDEIDVLVFSDFNYGCLPQSLVDQIIGMAKARGVLLAADSQSSSQIGDISRYRGMDLLTPTEHEARISTRNHQDGLVILAEQLRQQSDAANILLKLGEEGLLIHPAHDPECDWVTDQLGALNIAPRDVAGAGDSLLIASALTLACGGTIWEAGYLGSLAAAVQVSRVGNTPIRAKELLQLLQDLSE
ncbi:PfkB family carbohydrate kinase [Herbaspirillum sp. RTI4]|uniref:PfkB family carbohydrate kinase n=1 Tax=Herbaspirillum sp. RTI4 TaxID=3048640 RepID=UPI002AB52665|nr:PfkB family carbohydrate kinase [Herbaspirillum sp. RTI4]MDY7577031.1 PfkB family carbohydrate kinase [Herbaspirillum sp. RTI4]MEA9983102.1 PfkB family carbohydrate kinase [Herbaspirillum sp. RTI4]